MNKSDAIKLRDAIVEGISSGITPEGFDSSLERHFRFLAANNNFSALSVGIESQGQDHRICLCPNDTPRSNLAASEIGRFLAEPPIIRLFKNAALCLPRGFRFGRSKSPLLTPRRPLILGAEIDISGLLGSIGGFVTNEAGHEELLSCQHVFGALLGSEGGEHLSQPRSGFRHIHRVAKTNGSDPLLDGFISNWGELASALLVDASHGGVNQVPTGMGFDFEGHTIIPAPPELFFDVGTPVFKLGKSTGFTKGKILSCDQSFTLKQKQARGRAKAYTFDGGYSVVPADPRLRFSAPGDSGGLIFCESPEAGVLWGLGLISGSSNQRSDSNGRWTQATWACNLSRALVILKRTWKQRID